MKDSPYNSDLTYDLRQVAVFGEATYTLFDRLDLTAGLRWYDWEEDKTFKSGGSSQMHCSKPERDGILQRLHAPVHGRLRRDGPRGRERPGVTGLPSGRLQRSVEQPLCKDEYDTYRVIQRFEDETLWNYEVGIKSSYEKVTLNGSFFYTDISNLGVNVDAGSCSSRVAISVPEAHTMGGELELSVHPTDALLVTFAGSYVEAEFDSTVEPTRSRFRGPWLKASRTATAFRPCPTGNSPPWPRTPSRVSCSQRRVMSRPPGSSSAVRSPSPVTKSTHHSRPVLYMSIRMAPE